MPESYESTNPQDVLKLKQELAEALHQKAVLEAADHFYTFVRLCAHLMLDGNDYRDGAHIRQLASELEAVEEGIIKRFMLALPPGSMKSVLLMLFVGWCLGRHPSWRFMWISHTTEKAQESSGRVRDLIRSPEYQEIFPHVEIRDDKSGVTFWKLKTGGSFQPAGAGSNIAGYRFNVGIIDDPLSEQTALSDIERTKVNKWYPGGFRSRKLPDSRIILVNTRWHTDDLSGHLLDLAERNSKADQWHYVSIPALLDDKAADYLQLEPGGTYWPEYITDEDLEATKNSMPSSTWNALYMQTPTGEDGAIFTAESFKEWEDDDPPVCDELIMTLDTAYGMKNYNDYSVVQLWGIFYETEEDEEGEEINIPNAILINMVKGRWGYPKLRSTAMSLWHKYKPDRVIIENKASGQSLIQDLRMNRLPITPFTPDRDKVSRANAVTPMLEAGRVWLPKGKKYTAELMAEALQFPRGRHDDAVDAMVMALLYLGRLHELSQAEISKPEQPYRRTFRSYWGSLNGKRAA